MVRLSCCRYINLIELLEDDAEQGIEHFMEFFSPPRVCPVLRREGYRASFSLDAKTGHNFLDFGHRKRAVQLLGTHRVFFTMLSPPCTMYSSMQNANFGKMDPCVKARRFEEAHCLLDFSMQVAQHQLKTSHFFAFEHPVRATSWQRRSVTAVRGAAGVQAISFDQCRVNLRSPSGKPIQKRTTLMTNSSAIVRLFAPLQCQCTEPHQKIEGQDQGIKLSTWCQVYTAEFVDVIQKAVRLEWEEAQRRA